MKRDRWKPFGKRAHKGKIGGSLHSSTHLLVLILEVKTPQINSFKKPCDFIYSNGSSLHSYSSDSAVGFHMTEFSDKTEGRTSGGKANWKPPPF